MSNAKSDYEQMMENINYWIGPEETRETADSRERGALVRDSNGQCTPVTIIEYGRDTEVGFDVRWRETVFGTKIWMVPNPENPTDPEIVPCRGWLADINRTGQAAVFTDGHREYLLPF